MAPWIWESSLLVSVNQKGERDGLLPVVVVGSFCDNALLYIMKHLYCVFCLIWVFDFRLSRHLGI